MYKYILVICLLFPFLFSCKENKTEVTNVPILRASSIYNGDSVYNYIQLFADQNRVIALSYLEKAKEFKQSNPKKSIYYYKRAITLFPEYESYKELGALLVNTGMYEEASDAYRMIVDKVSVRINNGWEEVSLFKEPNEDDYYEYIVCLINKYNFLDSYEVHLIEEAGFDIQKFKEKITSDERIKLSREGEVFHDILLRFMTDEEIEKFQKSESLYNEFIHSIKDSSNVFQINEKKVHQFKYSNEEDEGDMQLSDMYIYFLKEKRENPNDWFDYNFTHVVKLNDSINAVVYAIDTSENAAPVEMRHIYHTIVTYKKGNIIDSKVIALQSGEQLTTMEFNSNKFTCNQFKRNWKKPYKKEDFDNEIISTNLISTKNFIINSEGKIEETTSPNLQATASQSSLDSSSGE